jgi:hypothetical protein
MSWKDPLRWFWVSLAGTIVLGILAAVFSRHPGLSQGLGYAVFGALCLVVLSAVAAVGVQIWEWFKSLRSPEARERLKMSVFWYGLIAALIAIVAVPAWLVDDYRHGSTMLGWPGIGPAIAASRLRDWPKALGEEARDMTVERCERSDDTFLCFVKKLDHDGVYRAMPCYFDGAVPNSKLLGTSLEQFCRRP